MVFVGFSFRHALLVPSFIAVCPFVGGVLAWYGEVESESDSAWIEKFMQSSRGLIGVFNAN